MTRSVFGKGFSLIIWAVLLMFLGACGGGGGSGGGEGGNSKGGGEDVAVAKIISPVATETTITAGSSVSFTSFHEDYLDDYTFSWNFGGGAPDSTAKDPGDVVFSTAGQYVVTLTVKGGGGTANDTRKVVVLPATPDPLAVEINNPATDLAIYAGQAVNFSGTVAGGTPAYTYLWNFAGGAVNQTVEDPGDVIFDTPGTYVVTFTVTDSASVSASVSRTVQVSEPDTNPVATITSPAGPVTISAGQSVVFQGNASEGNVPYAYHWNIGGYLTDEQNPGAIAFPSVGTFICSLTVTDEDGDTDTKYVTVSVVTDSKPSVTINSPAAGANIFRNGTCNFRGFVQGGNEPLSYHWDFGGARAAADKIDVEGAVLDTLGNFTATLTVTDVNGDSGSATVQFSVLDGAISQLQPTNGATIQGSYVDLSWTAVPGAMQYEVRVCTDSGCTNIVDSAVTDETSHTTGVLPQGLYYWDVRAIDSVFNLSSTAQRTFNVTPAGVTWKDMAVTITHGAGIRSDGTLWAWGLNTWGDLGIGDTSIISLDHPVQVGTDKDWKSVTVNNHATMAIKNDGTLWAAGAQANGRLGNGKTSGGLASITQIGTKHWRSVSLGTVHAVAIDDSGALWAWGSNTYGQCGLGQSVVTATEPTQVGQDTDWAKVVTGPYATLAIKADGTLYGTGYNANGVFGNATTVSRYTFAVIGTDAWKDVSLAASFALGIKADGTLYATGVNDLYQHGDGTTASKTIWTQVGNSDQWVSVEASENMALAIRKDGSLWGAGSCASGGVSSGAFGTYTITVLQQFTQLSAISSLAKVCLDTRSAMGLQTDGVLWVWGLDNSYQLGMLATTGSIAPPIRLETN